MAMIPKQSDNTLAAADNIRAAAYDAYTQYRSRGDLSPEAIKSGIARTFLKAKTAMEGLENSTGNYTKTFLADAQRKAFGIDDLAGHDPVKRASVSMSYRDALGRVAQLEGPREGLELLNQANTIGDEVLARAIAQYAWQNNGSGWGQWNDVLDAFTADRPTQARALAELSNASTPMNARDMWAFVVPVPPELESIDGNVTAIQALADKWPSA